MNIGIENFSKPENVGAEYEDSINSYEQLFTCLNSFIQNKLEQTEY